nr:MULTISPECIES: hypothetical protein [unclassified Frankia]
MRGSSSRDVLCPWSSAVYDLPSRVVVYLLLAKERRMGEPGAREAYQAARLAFELGRAVRELRQRRAWS